MKMNKKGFTLIEMLVVVAIIAILVAIIVPTIATATKKSQGATDAANLRSVTAKAAADYLDDQEITETYKMDVELLDLEDEEVVFYLDDNGDLVGVIDGYWVADFELVAETGDDLPDAGTADADWEAAAVAAG